LSEGAYVAAAIQLAGGILSFALLPGGASGKNVADRYVDPNPLGLLRKHTVALPPLSIDGWHQIKF